MISCFLYILEHHYINFPNTLNLITVGETAATQFLGWRLSLGNVFIILASQYVSADGLVAWKSTRLGSNFYAPNIFVKDIDDLDEKLTYKKRGSSVPECKYDIDIMIISAISIEMLETYCSKLGKFCNKDTIILIDSNFGCELEPLAIQQLNGYPYKCVMSIYSELECRQLSLGSYALVNDEHCLVRIGLSYMCGDASGNSRGATMHNEHAVAKELLIADDVDCKINRFIGLLRTTKWIKVKKYPNPRGMASKLWESIIPKISLNILSIIYENFDYEKLLKTKSTETIFKDLVVELLGICYAQCHLLVSKYLKKEEPPANGIFREEDINFDAIIGYCQQQKISLNNTTVSEHPEYLSLHFEAYCFYHRFEYPAHILLCQPLLLAKKYNVQCSNLNFLFGFYTRLLSLSGLSIYGGHCQQSMSLFERTLTINVNEATSSGNSSDPPPEDGEFNVNEENYGSTPTHPQHNSAGGYVVHGSDDSTDSFIPPELENFYLGSDDLSSFSVGSQESGKEEEIGLEARVARKGKVPKKDVSTPNGNSVMANQQLNRSSTSTGDLPRCGSEKSTVNSSQMSTHSQRSFYSHNSNSGTNLLARTGGLVGLDRRKERRGQLRGLEDMGIVAVPHFFRRFQKPRQNQMKQLNGNGNGNNNNNNGNDVNCYAVGRDITLTPGLSINGGLSLQEFELQLRTNRYMLAHEYQTIQGLSAQPPILKGLNGELCDKAELEERKKRYANLEIEFWKLQRKCNIDRGVILRPKTGPGDDLLNHIEILSRGNMGDILPFTTSRYGEVDTYNSLRRDRDLIMSMLERRFGHRNSVKSVIDQG